MDLKLVDIEIHHAAFEAEVKLVAKMQLPHSGIDEEVLDEVWELTQNITSSWTQGEHITWRDPAVEKRGGARSLSVGDGITIAGKTYLVKPAGFQAVPDTSHLWLNGKRPDA